MRSDIEGHAACLPSRFRNAKRHNLRSLLSLVIGHEEVRREARRKTKRIESSTHPDNGFFVVAHRIVQKISLASVALISFLAAFSLRTRTSLFAISLSPRVHKLIVEALVVD